MADVSDELWASADWTQTMIERHPWLRANRESIGVEHDGRRWFVPRRYQWPLLCVSVYGDYPSKPVGVRVAVSCKYGPEGWFNDCNLPRELVHALVEMLTELKVT